MCSSDLNQVLARRSAVIETLGGASVLCVDKTGTLTENQMKVVRIWTRAGDQIVGDARNLSDASVALMKVAALASAVTPVDPMDKAIRAVAPQADLAAGNAAGGPERTWPLRPELLAVVQLWRLPEGQLAAAKGAPEAIFRLCRLPESQVEELHAVIAQIGRAHV